MDDPNSSQPSPNRDFVSTTPPAHPLDIEALECSVRHLNIGENGPDFPILPAPSAPPEANALELSLPPELMAAIFTMACHADTHKFHTDKERHRKTTPFVLGHVCGQWRAIIWSIPEIWSHIPLCLESAKYHTQLSLLEGWLARSGQCPLTINLLFQDEDDWTNRLPIELVQLLASHAPRWRSINWVLPEAWYSILDEIRHNFLLLSNVSTQPLWSDSRLSASKRKRFDLFQFAPMLHDIYLNGYYLSDVVIHWDQLTRFTLQHIYLDECFYALSKTPYLTFCRIFTILINSTNRRVEETSIDLLALEQLVIDNSTWEDTARLLSHMSAPLLRTLELSSPQDDYFPSLPPLLAKLGCHLTQLKLIDFPCNKESEPEIIAFIRDIASIRELEIEIRALNAPVVEFLVELLKTHSPSQDAEADGKKKILPILEYFTFSGPVKRNAGFEELLLEVLQLRRVLVTETVERKCLPLLFFDLKAEGESEPMLTPALKEKYQALVDDGMCLNIVFGGISWL